MLDGEIVIAGTAGLDFDALSQRIHPAESRVELLWHRPRRPRSWPSTSWPSATTTSRTSPTPIRRRSLEKALKKAKPPIHLTPVTTVADVARDWFSRFEGAGLDGVVVKDG